MLLAALIPAGHTYAVAPDSVAAVPDDGDRDGTLALRYGLLYESRIDLERSSVAFPWNDPEDESHLRDRLSFMTSLSLPWRSRLFLKGATGARAADRPYYRELFALEQGHVAFAYPDMGIEARLFHRERVYRSGLLLLPLVTLDRPFTSARGAGVVLEAGRRRVLGVRYTESALRDDYRLDDYGGLPLLHGGADGFRYIEGGIRGYHGLRFELAVSQMRSIDYGDAVVLASGVGVEMLGLRLDMEMARSVTGDWGDVGRCRLFDLHLDEFEAGNGSDVFGEHVLFSAELDGLLIDAGSFGVLRLLPGYRFVGESFLNPAGDVPDPLVESYLTAWWTHPELDLLVALGARDRYETDARLGRRLLDGSARVRLKGGFTARGGVLYEVDGDPSLMASLADENEGYRLVASGRIDGAGARNDFSFLVDGALNLTGTVSVRSTLLLVESIESLYHLGFEFRPSRKFLLHLGFGSFRPFDEEISFQYDEIIESPVKERFVILTTRVWLGEI